MRILIWQIGEFFFTISPKLKNNHARNSAQRGHVWRTCTVLTRSYAPFDYKPPPPYFLLKYAAEVYLYLI